MQGSPAKRKYPDDLDHSYAQPGYVQPGYVQSGFVPPGYAQPGHVQPGYVQSGFVPPGYGQPGYVQPGYGLPGYVQPGNVQPGYVQPGYVQPGNVKPGYVQPGNVKPGKVKPGNVQPGDVKPGKIQPGNGKPGKVQPGQSGKRKNSKKNPGRRRKREIAKRTTHKTRAMTALMNGKYTTAFRILFKKMPAARRGFAQVLSDMIRCEIRAKNSKLSYLQSDLTLENVEQFSWQEFLKEMDRDCPLLTAVIKGALTKKNQMDTLRQKDRSLVPSVGMTLSNILASRNKRRFRLLVQLNSAVMWLSGCNQKLYSQLAPTGLCFETEKSARAIIEQLYQSYEKKVLSQKEAMENFLKGVRPENVPQSRRSAARSEMENTNEIHGFTLLYNNPNKSSTAKSDGKTPNQHSKMVQAYSAELLVPTLHLSSRDPGPEAVRSIPLEAILPDAEDVENLKEEFKTIIQRILVNCLPQVRGDPVFREIVTWRIPHDYDTEMTKQSNLTPLGVIEKEQEETHTSEMVKILSYYGQYVPRNQGSTHETILHCDAKTCREVVAVQDAFVNGETEWDRFQMFLPQTQNWRSRLQMAVDYTAEFSDPRSVEEKGTFAEIRNYLDRTNVFQDTRLCYGATYDFILTIVGALLLLASYKILNIPVDGEISNPNPKKKKKALLDSLTDQIIDMIWQDPNIEDVINATDEASRDNLCICKQHTGGDMIGCSNTSCPKGEWFHLDCVALSPSDVPDRDWFCSETCRKKARAKRVEIQQPYFDSKFEYTKGLLYKGLLQICLRDAVREGDGPRMVMHWKHQLLHFFQTGKMQHFVLGQRFLLHAMGGSSERIQEELIWGSVVNPTGGKGGCVEGDLFMEHFQKFFKGIPNYFRGNQTQPNIKRHNQIIAMNEEFCSQYTNKLAKQYDPLTTKGKRKKDDRIDVLKVVRHLKDEKLFDIIPGRCHDSFRGYVHFTGVSKPEKMKERLIYQRELLARRKELALDYAFNMSEEMDLGSC